MKTGYLQAVVVFRVLDGFVVLIAGCFTHGNIGSHRV
jgi:hypothetical protein